MSETKDGQMSGATANPVATADMTGENPPAPAAVTGAPTTTAPTDTPAKTEATTTAETGAAAGATRPDAELEDRAKEENKPEKNKNDPDDSPNAAPVSKIDQFMHEMHVRMLNLERKIVHLHNEHRRVGL